VTGGGAAGLSGGRTKSRSLLAATGAAFASDLAATAAAAAGSVFTSGLAASAVTTAAPIASAVTPATSLKTDISPPTQPPPWRRGRARGFWELVTAAKQKVHARKHVFPPIFQSKYGIPGEPGGQKAPSVGRKTAGTGAAGAGLAHARAALSDLETAQHS
jgi:hypothetical protein